MTRNHKSAAVSGALQEARDDPSLKFALVTGTALTAFLATAHACCLGLAAPDHLAALLQICSPLG